MEIQRRQSSSFTNEPNLVLWVHTHRCLFLVDLTATFREQWELERYDVWRSDAINYVRVKVLESISVNDCDSLGFMPVPHTFSVPQRFIDH